MNFFVLKMETNELYHIFDVVRCANDLISLKFFVENIPGFDPSHNYNCALLKAVDSGKTEVVEYMISLKEKFPRLKPLPAFKIALERGHSGVVAYFTNSKHNQEINEVDLGSKSLISAAVNGQLEIVQHLVSHKESFPGFNLAFERNQELSELLTKGIGSIKIFNFAKRNISRHKSIRSNQFCIYFSC